MTNQAPASDSLLKGFRFHAFRTNSNSVVMETDARYAEAALLAIIGLSVALPIVWDLTHPASEKSLFSVIIADGSFAAYATYFMIMAAFSTIPLMSAIGFWNCSFRRRFIFSDGMLHFQGAPGAALVTSFENIQAVVIFANPIRSTWTCNVALLIKRGSRDFLLCMCSHPICGPGECAAFHDQVDKMIEAHLPVAELLSSTIDKPIQIEQKAGWRSILRSRHRFWP
ncbi:MAG: hypothetical protein ACKVHE_18095 [Planctomycetales bacterium]|jgi:hypothetical protein